MLSLAAGFDNLIYYVKEENLRLEYDSGNSHNQASIKIYDYSATAQAGYEHRLMFSARGTPSRIVENAMCWILNHRNNKNIPAKTTIQV